MKWLTPGGVVASVAVGAAVVWGLGLPGLVLLMTFFVTGSLLTQIAGGSEGRRTARQVLANGGAAAAAALLGSWAGAAGALAAATADTWATEIGSFSRTPPRLLTTGVPVAPGTSGGVTALGTAGGVAGAALIGALVGVLGPAGWRGAFATAAAGVAGMLADSGAGATAQGKYQCPSCGNTSERAPSTCHGPMRRVAGWAWLDNDGVNLAATVLGGGVGALLSFLYE